MLPRRNRGLELRIRWSAGRSHSRDKALRSTDLQYQNRGDRLEYAHACDSPRRASRAGCVMGLRTSCSNKPDTINTIPV